jgi:hypothetical protein
MRESERMTNGHLRTYLNDHLAAASAGEQLFRRVASNQRSSPHAAELDALALAIREDRQRLRQLMSHLDVSENRPKQVIARVGELVGRFKPNGSVIHRSELSDLLEVEGLRVAVTAKRAGWRSLLASPVADDQHLHEELSDLLRRAEEQVSVLEDVHQAVAAKVLAGPA